MNNKIFDILTNYVAVGLADKIYIATTIKKNGKEIIVYNNGKEFVHLGIDDTKCRYGYIREIGEMELKPFNIGGCGNVYSKVLTYRLAIFDKNFDGNHSFITKIIMNGLRAKEIRVKKIWENSRTLFNSEGAFNREIELMPNNLFVAVDFTFEEKPNCGCDANENHCSKDINVICK